LATSGRSRREPDGSLVCEWISLVVSCTMLGLQQLD
jgi:hypothetical protein